MAAGCGLALVGAILGSVALIATAVVGSTRHGDGAGFVFYVTDDTGAAADPPSWFQPGDLLLIPLVVVPALVLVGIAVAATRRGRRSVGLALLALGFSGVTIYSGLQTLTGSVPSTCTACVHPEITNRDLLGGYPLISPSADRCEWREGNPLVGVSRQKVGVEPVSCPASYLEVADHRRAALTVQGLVLLVVGVGGAFISMVLINRVDPRPTAARARASPPAEERGD